MDNFGCTLSKSFVSVTTSRMDKHYETMYVIEEAVDKLTPILKFRSSSTVCIFRHICYNCINLYRDNFNNTLCHHHFLLAKKSHVLQLRLPLNFFPNKR